MQKIKAALWVLMAGCVLLFFLFALQLQQINFSNQLLILPEKAVSFDIPPETLDKVAEDEFLLAYESAENQMAVAFEGSYEVQRIGTNYLYPFIKSNPMISGSFFSQEDQKGKRPVTVINQQAAFRIFGQMDAAGSFIEIGGETFTVIGVMKDYGKEPVCYVPIGFLDSKAVRKITCRVSDEEGVTQSYIANTLKQWDITEDHYTYLHLGTLSYGVMEKIYTGTEIIMLSFFLVLFCKSMLSVKMLKRTVQKDLTYYYGLELFKKKPKLMLKSCFVAGITVIQLMCICMLVGRLGKKAIEGKFLLIAYHYQLGAAEGEALSLLGRLLEYANIIFAGLLILSLIGTIVCICELKTKGKEQCND